MFLIAAGGGSALAAQDSPTVCLKPGPAPRCSAILLTTFGAHFGLGTAESHGTRLRALLDWGLLFSVGHRSSVGATWLVSLDRDGVMGGPMARYRYWTSDSTSIDVGIGVPLHSSGYSTYATAYGLVRWNPSPDVGVALRPEWRLATDFTCTQSSGCLPHDRRVFAVSAGLEFSGPPGLIMSGVAAGVIGALALIIGSAAD